MTLTNLAENIMFIGIHGKTIMEHFEYRKGKNINDLREAIKKGIKDGNGKTEREVEGITLRLGKVLKRRVKND